MSEDETPLGEQIDDRNKIEESFTEDLPDCETCLSNTPELCPYENDGRTLKGNCI